MLRTESGSVQSKYLAVRAGLMARIRDLPEGSRLPAEKDLCIEFGVSRITLRHAVDGLVQNGWLRREHGRGTFVARPEQTDSHPEQFADQVTGFYRQQTEAGNIVTTRTLRQALVAATPEVSKALGIDVDGRVVELSRLRYVNGRLHQLVMTYVPYERFPEVLTRDFSVGSLFDFLAAEYDITLVRNDLVVRLERPDTNVSLNLEVPSDENLLVIDSTVYDQDGPVAYGTARHAPDASAITFSLRAPGNSPM